MKTTVTAHSEENPAPKLSLLAYAPFLSPFLFTEKSFGSSATCER